MQVDFIFFPLEYVMNVVTSLKRTTTVYDDEIAEMYNVLQPQKTAQ